MTSKDLQLPESLERALDETVRRIVEIARPQAVILFGSYAEGRAKAHSDFDFLVIADTDDTGSLATDLYVALAHLARGRWQDFPPCDVLVLTPEEWAYESELPGIVVWRARKHGVVVYGQAA